MTHQLIFYILLILTTPITDEECAGIQLLTQTKTFEEIAQKAEHDASEISLDFKAQCTGDGAMDAGYKDPDRLNRICSALEHSVEERKNQAIISRALAIRRQLVVENCK